MIIRYGIQQTNKFSPKIILLAWCWNKFYTLSRENQCSERLSKKVAVLLSSDFFA